MLFDFEGLMIVCVHNCNIMILWLNVMPTISPVCCINVSIILSHFCDVLQGTCSQNCQQLAYAPFHMGSQENIFRSNCGTKKRKKKKKKEKKRRSRRKQNSNTKKVANELLFILTRTHSMQSFEKIPFIKPQNDT